MKVTLWSNRSGLGIRLRPKDRDDGGYFEGHPKTIAVEIGGRQHEFNLPPSFWRMCSHFNDSRGHAPIREWILHHYGRLKFSTRSRPNLELIPLGEDKFRLISLDHRIDQGMSREASPRS